MPLAACADIRVVNWPNSVRVAVMRLMYDLRVRNRVQALLIDQDIGDFNMQPDNLIQRIERVPPAITVEQQLRLVDEHPVLQLAGRIELVVRELGFDCVELVANGLGIGRQSGLRNIVPAILAYVLAELGGEDGTSLHDPVISVVEKRPETLRLGFLRLSRTTEDNAAASSRGTIRTFSLTESSR